jgi:hypothetical protein
MLQVGKPFKEHPKVKYFLPGLANSDELRLTTDQRNTTMT